MSATRNAKRKAKRAKPIKDWQTATIRQLAMLFPESKAQAFRITSSPDCLYYIMGKIKKLRIGEKVSYARVLKIDEQTLNIRTTSIFINLMDVIIPITNKEFFDTGMTIYNKLSFQNKIKKTQALTELIKKYEYYSFRTYRKKAQKVLSEA